MSDFNFKNWDLNESNNKVKKKINRIDSNGLSDIINDLKNELVENGLWNRQYGINDPAADKRGEDLHNRSWGDNELNADEWEELQGYYNNMDADDRDEDAKDFFVGGIEIEDAKKSLENDPGVTIVDDPVDAGMFEMDDPSEQDSLAIGLDESDDDDESLSTATRYDLALQDAEGEDFEGLSAASDIFDMLASQMSEQNTDDNDVPEEGELDLIGVFDQGEWENMPEEGELEYIGMSEQDDDEIDRSLKGLEGPFTFKGGRELYYDPREEGGQYYDRGTDIYLDNDEASRVIMGEQSSLSPEGDQDGGKTQVPLDMIFTIVHDFCPLWWGGQADRLYRIGSSGTMYTDDIDYVEMKIEIALEQDDHSDPFYTEMLHEAKEEIENVSRQFGSGMSEADEMDIDINDQSAAGSFYTGEGSSDQPAVGDEMNYMGEQNFLKRMFAPKQNRELPNAVKKHSELPAKFMSWVQAHKTGKDTRTKMMLAKKVLDMVQDIGNEEEAIKNLAHWINYSPEGFIDMFKQLRSDAEGALMSEMEDGQRSIPEPFWTHGFPRVRIKDVAEAIGDSMVPGQDKTSTLSLIDIMRQELDALEANINSEN